MLFVELADLGSREVFRMMMQVEEELLFQCCRVLELEDGGGWIMATGLYGLARIDDKRLDVGLFPAAVKEAGREESH